MYKTFNPNTEAPTGSKNAASIPRMPKHYVEKLKELRAVFADDLLGCDAKWTLFVAAAFSYRYNCTLKPFPPKFGEDPSGTSFTIDTVIGAISETPNFMTLFEDMMRETLQDINLDTIDLLHFVLIKTRDTYLRLLDPEEVDGVLSSVQGSESKYLPSLAFEVVSAKGFHSHTDFRARNDNFEFKLAFFSQKLEWFFTVLHNGFHAAQIDSLQMSTDLYTSLQQSPANPAWGASQCGSYISCVAVCEFPCDDQLIKVTPNARDKSCVDFELNDPSKGRIRYLLFYGCRCPKVNKSQEQKGGFFDWIKLKKFSLKWASRLMIFASVQACIVFCKNFFATE